MDWIKLSTTKIKQVYYELLFNHCYLCHARINHTETSRHTPNSTLCQYCREGLAKNTPCCQHCRRSDHTSNSLCGRCQVSPPPYQVCVAPFRFEGIVKTLIHSVKFHQGNHYARPLAYLLSEHLVDIYAQDNWPEQLLYVPSHPSRIRERGFCQTQAMTTQLISILQGHVKEACPTRPTQNPLIKIKNTQAQHSLSRKDRLTAPQNSYKVQAPIAKHIALFDDVMTTGSTIETCTKLLIDAGAERVDIWVIARTPDKEH